MRSLVLAGKRENPKFETDKYFRIEKEVSDDDFGRIVVRRKAPHNERKHQISIIALVKQSLTTQLVRLTTKVSETNRSYLSPRLNSISMRMYLIVWLLGIFSALTVAQDIDLNAPSGSKGFKILGGTPDDRCANSVSNAGDMNGDGFDDVVIGAFFANTPNAVDAGVVYVIFGRNVVAGGASAFTDIALTGPSVPLATTVGFRILGATIDDRLGSSVSAAGDVNKDGIDDIIIGAYIADTTGGTNAGISYVIWGRSLTTQNTHPFGDIQLPTITMPANIGFRILGAAASDYSGWSVSAAGDMNADGIGDVIVGAYQATPSSGNKAGIAYVLFGRNIANGAPAFNDVQLTTGTNVMSTSEGFRILGAGADNACGWSVSTAGDVNGDGVGDIIVGAYAASSSSVVFAGISYVIFGRSAFTQLTTPFLDVTLTNSALPANIGFRILGAAQDDNSGYSVSTAGDFNGDGISDIMVGAHNADVPGMSDPGIVYVIFGRNVAQGAAPFGDVQLSNNAVVMPLSVGFRIIGAVNYDLLGYSVRYANDVNGDGVSDVIIGAYLADPYVTKSAAGISYVLYGRNMSTPSATPLTDIYLTAAALDASIGFRILGAAVDDRSGSSVSAAGDVNNDGVGDVIIGADFGNIDAGDNAGTAFIVFGTPPAPTSQPSSTPSGQPSTQPSAQPIRQPSGQPTLKPSCQPSGQPSMQPTKQPSSLPTSQPSKQPSVMPSTKPTGQPSRQPSVQPCNQPSRQPSGQPTMQPRGSPSTPPSAQPTRQPSSQPLSHPSAQPSARPSTSPSAQPSGQPSTQPSVQPSGKPSTLPSTQPTDRPSAQPSERPSAHPSSQPTSQPTRLPSMQPSSQPSAWPSVQPSSMPSMQPSKQPRSQPSSLPSVQPTNQPSSVPSTHPSSLPSGQPSMQSSSQPTAQPFSWPSSQPTDKPSTEPSALPTTPPSAQPSTQPSAQPSIQPSGLPTTQHTVSPSTQPSCQPSTQPSHQPTSRPTCQPSAFPTALPTDTKMAGEWVSALENPSKISILVRNTVWVCGTSSNTDATSITGAHCVIVEPLRGSQLAKYVFSWDDISSILASSNDASNVIISGTTTLAGFRRTDTANCVIGNSELVCTAQSLVDTSFAAGSYVSAVGKAVYFGTDGEQLSAAVADLAGNTIRNYRYTQNVMAMVQVSHATSPPNYVGSFLAGTCTSLTFLANYICAGVVRTDSGTMTAMYLAPASSHIVNNVNLVNAMALEYKNPDSFIAGGLELSDGAGMQAYVVRVNSLYYSVLYGMRYRMRTAETNNRRALQDAPAFTSVVKGMVLIDTFIYMIVSGTDFTESSKHSSTYILKTDTVTGQIVQQVQIHSPVAVLRCTNIAASAARHVIMSCTEKSNDNESRALLISMDQDLTLSQLPAGFRRYENRTFAAERILFHRTTFPVSVEPVTRSINNYIFTTNKEGPTLRPSAAPTSQPSMQPSGAPSGQPSSSPTAAPSVSPQPSSQPSSSGPTNTYNPTVKPTQRPSTTPSKGPTVSPTVRPTVKPTARPTAVPSVTPTLLLSVGPTVQLTRSPSPKPSRSPVVHPTALPTREPSIMPTVVTSEVQSKAPSNDRAYLIVGYVAAGLCGLWLLYALRRWCQYKLEGVQSDANRTLYVESIADKPKPRFPICAYLVSLFLTVEAAEVDFVPIAAPNSTYSGVGANIEGLDLEANGSACGERCSKTTMMPKIAEGKATAVSSRASSCGSDVDVFCCKDVPPYNPDSGKGESSYVSSEYAPSLSEEETSYAEYEEMSGGSDVVYSLSSGGEKDSQDVSSDGHGGFVDYSAYPSYYNNTWDAGDDEDANDRGGEVW